MNKQTIGFDRELKLRWLDLTAGLAREGADLAQIRARLQAHLADEIPGPKARRNTITVLTRIWVRVPPEHQPLQAEALTFLPNVLPEDRLWLHWGMALLAYPFFHDVAEVVGRLLTLQGACESTQIQQRMREVWGQRTTLERAVSRVLQTFTLWEVIQEAAVSPRPAYQPAPLRQTRNVPLALWLCESIIRSARQSSGQSEAQLPLAQLIQAPSIFPFDLAPHLAAVRRSNRFEVNRQGLNLEMVAPAG